MNARVIATKLSPMQRTNPTKTKSAAANDEFERLELPRKEHQQTINRKTTTKEGTIGKEQRVLARFMGGRFPFQRKLVLDMMGLCGEDLPLEDLTNLGLRNLSLRGNQLGEIPVLSMPTLCHLDLSECGLMTLPPQLNLPRLKRLNLAHNHLQHFPNNRILSGLLMLQDLDLSGNHLSEIFIPKGVLEHLERLDVGDNRLDAFPESLTRLASLRELDTKNNLLERIPPFLLFRMHLHCLLVSGNPLLQPPMETCERGIPSMKHYYQQLQTETRKQPRQESFLIKKQPTRAPPTLHAKASLSTPPPPPPPLPSRTGVQAREPFRTRSMDPGFVPPPASSFGQQEEPVKIGTEAPTNDTLKVVVVGANLSGKTSLIKRLIHRTDTNVPYVDSGRLGLDIYEWKPQGTKLSVWDFTGHQKYHAAQELFFSSHVLYIVVWDMGAFNTETYRQQREFHAGTVCFDSSDSDSDSDDDFMAEEETKRADRALEQDIDDRVRFWVDCIQSRAPGSTILPVASQRDQFEHPGEAKRRCRILKRRLEQHNRRNNGSPEPKFVFSDNEQGIYCVSNTTCSFIDELRERIVSLSTQQQNELGHHVGAQIPLLYMQVLDVVRRIRCRHKVIEMDHLLDMLRTKITMVDPKKVKAALRFLTEIGELMYFEPPPNNNHEPPMRFNKDNEADWIVAGDEDDSLYDYVFLNPRWLLAAVSCILRSDLDRVVEETRRLHATKRDTTGDFFQYKTRCPLITANEVLMLWKETKLTAKAARLAQPGQKAEHVFDYLLRLMVHYGLSVPIVPIAPQEAATIEDDGESNNNHDEPLHYFFLPSLLGRGDLAAAWTYKNLDCTKTTLCHSILFPNGISSTFMERITASVLSSIYGICTQNQGKIMVSHASNGDPVVALDGPLCLKEMLCWQSAFILVISTGGGTNKRQDSVEIFVHLADRDSDLCVGADSMGVGMKRLIISAKGPVGNGGTPIWSGGYILLKAAISRVVNEHQECACEKQAFCPECIARRPVSMASAWDWGILCRAAKNGEETIRCHHGHRVDTRLVSGPCEFNKKKH